LTTFESTSDSVSSGSSRASSSEATVIVVEVFPAAIVRLLLAEV
jgi:hypothetical protein